MKIWKKCQLLKVFQIRFRSYLKLEKTLTCGALWSVALSPHAAPWLAAVCSPIWTRAAQVFRHCLSCLKPRRCHLPCLKPRRRSDRRVRVPHRCHGPKPHAATGRVSHCTTVSSHRAGRHSPLSSSSSAGRRSAVSHHRAEPLSAASPAA
jgi:hypothetical protein